MKKLITLLLFSIWGFGFAQTNLVPNFSFENIADSTACLNGGPGTFYPVNWNSYNGSPDYFNSYCCCGASIPSNTFGYQYPATGNGYWGLLTRNSFYQHHREFIGAQLLSPLSVGQKYFVSVKINLSNLSDCATNKFGVLFTTYSHIDTVFAASIWGIKDFAHVYSDSIITDSVSWFSIKGSFVADSAYSNIIIGNFFDDANTDTISFDGTSCDAYYYVDDICVSTDSLKCDNPASVKSLSKSKIKIFPNPVSKKLVIENPHLNKIKFTLYNSLGIEVIKRNSSNSSLFEIDVSDLPQGIYFLRLKQNDEFITQQIIISRTNN
jgi:hypothetical protein